MNGAVIEKPAVIVRTERGLSIAGTRITIYDILDYLKQDWSPGWIQYWLNLTDEQIGEPCAISRSIGPRWKPNTNRCCNK
jgi:hypothetical protein